MYVIDPPGTHSASATRPWKRSQKRLSCGVRGRGGDALCWVLVHGACCSRGANLTGSRAGCLWGKSMCTCMCVCVVLSAQTQLSVCMLPWHIASLAPMA